MSCFGHKNTLFIILFSVWKKGQCINEYKNNAKITQICISNVGDGGGGVDQSRFVQPSPGGDMQE